MRTGKSFRNIKRDRTLSLKIIIFTVLLFTAAGATPVMAGQKVDSGTRAVTMSRNAAFTLETLSGNAKVTHIAQYSDNPKIISVSADGTFTCLAAGTARVTVIAAGGYTDNIDIRVVDLDEYAKEVFRLTNLEREKYGLPALSGNDAGLNAAAAIRAGEIKRSLSHTRPNGGQCFSVLDEIGAIYSSAAENIAGGYATPAAVVEGWMNSPGHRKNILNGNLTHLGVSVEINENGRLYWAQMFCGM